jgi:WXXGXW repeat (2 copies)
MRLKSNPLLVAAACACALGLTLSVVPRYAVAQISVSITLAPPALPEYEQPVLAEEGGIWVPGYWDYARDGYYWVPGTWVQPPGYGLLWTPGYWGWGNGGYAWNAGYWGSSVGFYGGIDYGFGYSGHGYTGGRWQGQHFYYNTAVNHVNVTNIHNTYTETTVNNTTVNRVSFNGGRGGLTARPTPTEQAAARAPHQPATALQEQHRQAAMASHPLLASVNHGKPEITATSKPAEFNTREVAKASPAGSPERAPHNTAVPTPIEQRAPVHATEVPALTHFAAQTTGNVERYNETLRQQNNLRDRQEKQRQELQQSQATDHERAVKQPSASGSGQELKRQHQAQTQELVQRHATEQKTLQETQGKKPEEKREQPHPK